jgi:exosortase
MNYLITGSSELSMFEMPEEKTASHATESGWRQEIVRLWQTWPRLGLVAVLAAVWILLFQFFGNSTLGYVQTKSLFGWWWWMESRHAQVGEGAEAGHGRVDFGKLFDSDESFALIVPLAVAALIWYKRKELYLLPKQIWWPALGLLIFALLVHTLGYLVQQTRISMVGFFVGLYALTGLMWGSAWLRLALFPFSLLLFCVPLGSGGVEIVTFPLRLLATKITAFLCHSGLGINVIQTGTQLMDAAGSYQYEVAAACSGIRSLTAILAFGVIYGYMTFKTSSRRLLVALAAFPLAVVANVLRLTLIIVAAEAFGQKAGNFVHENWLLSLVPYLPALGGMLLLGWWLRENKSGQRNEAPIMVAGAQQKL